MLIPGPNIRLEEVFPSVPVTLNSPFSSFITYIVCYSFPPCLCVQGWGDILESCIQPEFPFRAVAQGMYLKSGFFATLLLCEAHCKASLEQLHPAAFGHCWSSFPRVFGERMNSFIRTKFGPES